MTLAPYICFHNHKVSCIVANWVVEVYETNGQGAHVHRISAIPYACIEGYMSLTMLEFTNDIES